MADESITEKIAVYNSALQFERIPSAVIEAAKLHILDSLGCLLAGSRLEPGKLAYELAVAASGANAESTLLGTHRRASYCDAVQVMSVAAHCGEMDDIHGGADRTQGMVFLWVGTVPQRKHRVTHELIECAFLFENGLRG